MAMLLLDVTGRFMMMMVMMPVSANMNMIRLARDTL
jgi:hypothetical protein